ncbi:hypothetical protein [Synoicihabitans lomoniglobus]|uniref:Uncharacterized protein n=1 Tax=Synoicihabitans lomoniglobus TaxID=2909285 RepID=A0AAF0CP30_9BACT|nr:hypothetical protein [Opitutaceae bacterium LMO-M01]WED65330.1 hypothetical protein PXH66_00520 [Opitutaceae bacterium LMO-M01]
MRIVIRLSLLCALLLGLSTPALAADGDTVSLRAILVSASREPGKTDRSLSAYESTLRRILRFESFQQLGSGRARVAKPGEGKINLGQGHQLTVSTEASQGDRVRVQLEWTGGGHSLMRTGLVLRPGVPAVLGGPSRNDHEVYAVIVIAE